MNKQIGKDGSAKRVRQSEGESRDECGYSPSLVNEHRIYKISRPNWNANAARYSMYLPQPADRKEVLYFRRCCRWI